MSLGAALDPETWDPEKGDGVEFNIILKNSGEYNKIFSHYLDPKNNREDRIWKKFEVDLSLYAGKTVTIEFSTLPGPHNDDRFDWALWGSPVIIDKSNTLNDQ